MLTETTGRARAPANMLLASTLLRLGDAIEAESALEDASKWVEDGDERIEHTFLLGVCYQKSGREELASRAFDEVLRATDGAHWRARFHMALLAVSQGWFDEAIALLHDVVEANPEHAESLAILEKLIERRDAENNRLEPPSGDEPKA